MLDVTGLTRRFGGLLAVDGVSLRVPSQGITALIGPNGAGKTTTFAMIAGFVACDAGRVRLDGQDVTGWSPERIAEAGMVRTFQITQPFGGLTVAENIRVGSFLRLADAGAAMAEARAIGLRLGLGAFLDRPAAALTVSGRKRLELARALATKPKLLLLDEVMAGLNPSEVAGIIDVILAIRAEGVTILLIEHLMQAVAALADHAYVLAEGRLIAEGTPREIAGNAKVIEAYLGRGAAQRMAHG